MRAGLTWPLATFRRVNMLCRQVFHRARLGSRRSKANTASGPPIPSASLNGHTMILAGPFQWGQVRCGDPETRLPAGFYHQGQLEDRGRKLPGELSLVLLGSSPSAAL